MKKIILFFTVIVLSYNGNTQSINDNWILGNNLINFDNQNVTISMPPVILSNDAGARAIVSDEYGDLLFYLANDDKLYDKNGVVFGGPIKKFYDEKIRQNSLIIPNPMNKKEFIGISTYEEGVLSIPATAYNDYEAFIVTFNDLSYPNGKVVWSNKSLLLFSDSNYSYHSPPSYSSLSATKKNDDSGYYLILGTKNGSTPIFIIKDINFSDSNFDNAQNTQVVQLPSGLLPNSNTFNPLRTLSKISGDGAHFAFLLSNQTHNYVFLADFNNSTGSLSNFRFVKYSNNTEIKDLEFSADSSLLYMLTGNEISIRDVINFNTNEKILVETNPIGKSNFQRAANEEIYILDWHEDTNW